MSLVNDMLRDLDRRKRQPAGPASSAYLIDDNQNDSFLKKWRSPLFALAGVICLVVLILVLLERNNDQVESDVFENQIRMASENNPAVVTPNTQSQNIRLSEVSNTSVGFTLAIESDDEFSYQVISRSDYEIDILLPEINAIGMNEVRIPGFSLLQSATGTHLIVKLNERTDFQLSRESDADGAVKLSIDAIYRRTDQESESELTGISSSNNQDEIQKAGQLDVAVSTSADSADSSIAGDGNTAETAMSAMTPQADQGTSEIAVRKPRELTFEERDQNTSQQAAKLVERGQLMSAYQGLLDYIGNNPQAHQSRETLAALLFAQQEYVQANAVIEQGLAIAPNYGPFKKIKARLLLVNQQPELAVELLKNVAPNLANDPEYFELLASSYQQSDQYMDSIETYQNLIRFNNKVARWWAGMGISHEALGNVNEAVVSYQAALQSPDLEPALRQYSQNRIRFLSN